MLIQRCRVIAANRDEFFDRPTKEADYWPNAEHVLAGQDLGHNVLGTKAPAAITIEDDPTTSYRTRSVPNLEDSSAPEHFHGTWLGVTRDGRFSYVTNYRENPKFIAKDAASRGYLVRDFLLPTSKEAATDPLRSPERYASAVAAKVRGYNGFNLVVGRVIPGDARGVEAWYIGNRDEGANQAAPVANGVVHGLSNGSFITSASWPKVIRGKKVFEDILSGMTTPTAKEQEDELVNRLLELLTCELYVL
ncbi:hypothetical protein HK101_000784 [Irineochytrium annulatum]|nr:hypothetical protein HK101_000784 [Irineochytrium annulatum]